MEKLRRAGEKSNGKDEREMTAKYAFKQSIPIMAGYIVFGMGFGVLLEAKGYGVLWAIAMSVFIYAGSMHYVAIDLITGGSCYGTARTSGGIFSKRRWHDLTESRYKFPLCLFQRGGD